MWSVLRLARACACVLALMVSATAQAQAGGRWLVLPYGVGDNAEARAAADRMQLALQGLELSALSSHEARDRYVSNSRLPQSLETKEIELLVKEGQAALEHVAYGRHAAAQKSVREALTRAERALETLNRKTETARRVLDACLILVRSELGQEKRERALETAMRCRRLVPDVSPSETTHPASVIGVLAEAENKLRRWQVGKLRVESTPRVGCPVYVNGRHLGVTPFVLDRAAEGQYRVQVECDSVAGRVHEVILGETPVTLTVDALLDRALTSEPRLSLSYPQSKLARACAVTHATAIGKQVDADDVVLVSVRDAQLSLVRVQVSQGRAIAEATITRRTSDFSESDLEHAAEALLSGRTVAWVAGESPGAQPALAATNGQAAQPSAGVPSEPAPRADAARASDPRRRALRVKVAAMTLGGVGVAALATGWGYEVRQGTLRDELRQTTFDDPRRPKLQSEFDGARDLTLVGVAGSALMAASVPWLLPEAQSIPWWSYLAGGAGLSLAGAGVVEFALSDRCIAPTTDGECLERRDRRERGFLLISSGLSLLAVPITHALRLALGEHRVQIGARVARVGDSVLLGAEGSF